MKLHFIGLFILVTLLVSCHHAADVYMLKRDEIINRYASAIRWGEFDKAAQFQNPAFRTVPDKVWLKNIHVASYDIVFVDEKPGGKVVENTVQIRYFLESEGIEKSITDHQVWGFDDEFDKWMLNSPLPAFR